MVGSRKGKARAPPVEDKVTAALPLGKQLAHTDKKVRDRAIASLIAFLSAGDQAPSSDDAEADGNEAGPSGYVPLPEKEMDKLWKGLFYCFWMSDKPLVQQALASSLAELLMQIDPLLPSSSTARERQSARYTAALDFLAGFWRAIIREWIGIDRLRMDKFYLLVRRYMNASFRLLARESWAPDSLEAMHGLLGGPDGPLRWDNLKLPTSVSTHLADVWLDELDAALGRPEVDSQPCAPLVPLLQPLIVLLARTPSKTVHDRLMTTLFTPLLSALQLASAEVDESEPSNKKHKAEPMYAHIVTRCCVGPDAHDTPARPAQLRNAVLKAVFDEAAKEGTVESNRRKMYKLWREEGGDDDEDDDE